MYRKLELRTLMFWCTKDLSLKTNHGNLKLSSVRLIQTTNFTLKDHENLQENTEKTDKIEQTKVDQKLIRVAVIGAPNAGKSSFINSLINHRVCPTSRKVHTTRTFSKAVFNKDESQMILFDTPGLVTNSEMKKHKLSESFISSCRHSIQHADMIAVVHDVSNSYTRNNLHPTVLETLMAYPKLPSILILNKIDMLKSKRILLDLVNVLTEKTLSCNDRRYLPWKTTGEEFLKDMSRPVKYKSIKSVGWPHFSSIFMVSSLSSDGVYSVMKYIMEQSITNPWEYKNGEFTDQKTEDLIVDNVRAVLLDFLPQEIPYNLHCEIDYFEKRNDKIVAFVNVVCPTKRIEKLVAGKNDIRLKQISETVTSDLVRLFKYTVSLVVNVTSRNEKKKK